MRLIDSKKSREACNELEARFMDGERLTIEEIIQEYFKTNNIANYINSKTIVKGWIATLKRRFWSGYERWFGSLDSEGHYGILVPGSEAEPMYALVRYFNLMKGNARRAISLRNEAKSMGMLLKSKDIQMMLPQPPQEKD